MKKIILLLFLIPNLVMAESYLCITDASGGVRFNERNDKYEGTGFKEGRKYILKKLRNSEEYVQEWANWSWNKFGEKNENINLTDCKYVEAIGLLKCDTSGGQLWFNYKKLRFALTEMFGFYGSDPNDDTYLEVGSCSKI